MNLHIPPFLNYECRACGECCREFEIGLTPSEYERLSGEDWPARDPEIDVADPFAKASRRAGTASHRFALRSDGTCAFLAKNARCIIHKHLGYEAKTLTCRLFPLTLVSTPAGWFAGVRFNCRAVAEGLGPPLETMRPRLERLCAELRDTGRAMRFPDRVDFDGRQSLSWRDYLKAERVLVNLFLRPDLDLHTRVAAAWRTVDLMRQAELEKVGGERFAEFMNLIATGAVYELQQDGLPRKRPGLMPRWLFYQYLFLLYGGSGAPALAKGRLRRLWDRLRGAKTAWNFGTRSGRVPLFGRRPGVSLRAVSAQHIGELDEGSQAALERFLAGKLFGKQIFGPFYFGFNFLQGFIALLCTYAALLWYAKASALADDRDAVEHKDVIRALRRVDFSFGHSPALGAWTEKQRLRWLGEGDTPARIDAWQALAPEREG